MHEYEETIISLLTSGHPHDALKVWESGRKRTCSNEWCWCADCLEAHLRYLSLLSPGSNYWKLADNLKADL